jgi:transposase-like protein
MPRKTHSNEFKSKVALEAIREQKTINEIADSYQIHPVQVSQWKRQVLDELPKVFSRRSTGRADKAQEELMANLYQKLGQKDMELDWLKKKMGNRR